MNQILKLLVAECVEPKAELGDKRRQEQDEYKIARKLFILRVPEDFTY